jgi:hypothetical protein
MKMMASLSGRSLVSMTLKKKILYKRESAARKEAKAVRYRRSSESASNRPRIPVY